MKLTVSKICGNNTCIIGELHEKERENGKIFQEIKLELS